MKSLYLIVFIALYCPCHAQAADGERFFLELSPDSTEQLEHLFDALEADLAGGLAQVDPVVVVLHGPEAGAFTRQQYVNNRQLVDRAALLDAHGLVDVKMCATWMRSNGITDADLPAFIETVPFAPREIERLNQEGYLPVEAVEL